MKIIIIFFQLLFLFICEKAIDKRLSCKDFKIGKFQLISKDTKRKYLIKRTKDFQIEQTFDLTTNKKIKKDRYYKITWKNDCEYSLLLDTSKSEYDEIDLYVNSVGGYKCLIRSVENNCATVETNVEEDHFNSKICIVINKVIQ
ncbi:MULTISPECIES: hypothetical protein [Chryseobacterium]|uniref:Uncharacterized protein n=1 Tax=Chryseobacterium geocarposphaerae TaxID=1416776 RepID=A0ABU1LH22_9FLAO|nr:MULTISPECIES: hypothetical protein [Chryseobacterium]MDR6405855.1 hypothetical protein [Chryseobacterium geocarposphaerae]MDR6698981.1 hypothetical protein [Chryseobacterium ginsenosidimutans]